MTRDKHVREPVAPTVDFETGEVLTDRSRSDFAGSSRRRRARLDAEGGGGLSADSDGGSPDRLRRRTELRAQSVANTRVQGENGSMPVNGADPKAPPLCAFYDLLDDPEQTSFQFERGRARRGVPVYGQYPKPLIPKLLPWLRCLRSDIVHVCSGALRPGEGIRVDIRPDARPDVLADGRHLPFRTGSMAAVLIDPPYTKHYARELYGVDYPRPSHLLAEAARVVRPGGRIGFVHYITPKPAPGTRFVRGFGLSTGFDMPVRAVSVFEVDHVGLFAGVA